MMLQTVDVRLHGNGNGQVDPGETDPADLDSNHDGIPDGMEVIVEPAVFPYSYTNRVTRDFYTVEPPRSRALPDVQFQMRWSWLLPGFAKHHGTYYECAGPLEPPVYSEQSTEFQWPAWGPGRRIEWNDVQGGFDHGPIDRPPSAQIPVPWDQVTGAWARPATRERAGIPPGACRSNPPAGHRP